MELRVRVKPGQDGFYGCLRSETLFPEFILKQPEDLGSWMEPVGWVPIHDSNGAIVGTRPADPEAPPPPPPDPGDRSIERDAQIRKAVIALEHNNPAHWTALGLPSMEAVKEKIGGMVKRDEIEAVMPGYVRDMNKAGEPR